jgi:hypothetical protein
VHCRPLFHLLAGQIITFVVIFVTKMEYFIP